MTRTLGGRLVVSIKSQRRRMSTRILRETRLDKIRRHVYVSWREKVSHSNKAQSGYARRRDVTQLPKVSRRDESKRERIFDEENGEGEINEKEEMSPRARGQNCSFLRVAEAGSERLRVKAVKGRERKRSERTSSAAEKRDNVREKGESTLTSRLPSSLEDLPVFTSVR